MILLYIHRFASPDYNFQYLQGVFDTSLWDKVCQQLWTGRWFYPDTPVSSTNHLGVKPIIHQSELRTYTQIVPFKENSSFRFAVL
jgi:hypothetical protein